MDAPAPVRTVLDALAQARSAHDATALAALYLDDGLIILPGGERLHGRAAIEAWYRAAAPRSVRDTPKATPPKVYFFPPLVHALTTASGRHGEKHSFVDILMADSAGGYRVACSSWTLR